MTGRPTPKTLDTVVKVRMGQEDKAALKVMADRARMTVSALARRRLLGLKVTFHPSLAAMEHLRRACVRVQALAAGGADGAQTAAILAALRAAMDALIAPERSD